MDYQAKLQNKLSGEVLIKNLGYLSKSQSQDIQTNLCHFADSLEHLI